VAKPRASYGWRVRAATEEEGGASEAMLPLDANEATCNHIGARPNKQTRTHPARISIDKQGTKTGRPHRNEIWYVLTQTNNSSRPEANGQRKMSRPGARMAYRRRRSGEGSSGDVGDRKGRSCLGFWFWVGWSD
jgi:hypothetical protein